MSTKIDLPGGGWAEIKDPDELTNRERKLLRRYSLAATETRSRLIAGGVKPGQTADSLDEETLTKLYETLTVDDLDGIDNIQAAFIVAYTASWSLDQPKPTLETVDDLPGPIFDALAAATTQLGDGSLDTTVDGAADPGSPTGPSPA